MNERERIDAIEARVNAATGGEWVWKPFRNSLQLFEELRTKEGGTVLTTVYGSENVGDVMMVAYPDRDLIAAAPADIRYLLARISELEADERKNITWTERHERALQSAHQRLIDAGIVFEKNGQPNSSAIILYALEQIAKRKRKAEKGGTE